MQNLADLAFFKKRDKSFIKMLNRIGPGTDSCDAPDNSNSQKNISWFILTLYFVHSRHEYINLTTSLDNPIGTKLCDK